MKISQTKTNKVMKKIIKNIFSFFCEEENVTTFKPNNIIIVGGKAIVVDSTGKIRD